MFKTTELCDHLNKHSLLEHEINAKNNTKGLNNRETEASTDTLVMYLLSSPNCPLHCCYFSAWGRVLKLNYFVVHEFSFPSSEYEEE